MPLGRLALAPARACRTVSSETPARLRASGEISTRTAGRAAPPTVTSPTPCTWAIFWASTVEAASYIWARVMVGEVTLRIMIGASAGFILR